NGEVDKTEEALNHFLLFFPNSSGANWIMSRIQLSLDHPEKAMNYIEREPDPFWKLYGKCMVIYAMGDKQEADSLLGRFIADYSEDMAEPNIADIYAFREEKDEAFKWLEQAFENKD